MKNAFILLSLLSFTTVAQQWDWAVKADSAFGDQYARMICRDNGFVYVLLGQQGRSVINNTKLDSGCVIVKVSASGQIAWARHYPGEMRGIYADPSGKIYI